MTEYGKKLYKTPPKHFRAIGAGAIKKAKLTKDKKKYIPIKWDGTTHQCEELKSAKNKARKLTKNDLTPEEIEKYEKNINSK